MKTIAKLTIPFEIKEQYDQYVTKNSHVMCSLLSILNTEKNRLENETDEISPFTFFEYRAKNSDHAIKKHFVNENKCPQKMSEIIEKINDIFGIRIICYSKREIYKAISFLERYADEHPDSFRIDDSTYKLGVRPEKRTPDAYIKNYVLHPKDTGYRSVHLKTLVKSDNNEWIKVEIQVRSILMHVWSHVDHVVRYGKNRNDIKILYTNQEQCSVIEPFEENHQKELPTITFLALFSISRLLNVVDGLISTLYDDEDGIIERDAIGTIGKIAEISDAIEKIL